MNLSVKNLFMFNANMLKSQIRISSDNGNAYLIIIIKECDKVNKKLMTPGT